jgi:hypothetical protein
MHDTPLICLTRISMPHGARGAAIPADLAAGVAEYCAKLRSFWRASPISVRALDSFPVKISA